MRRIISWPPAVIAAVLAIVAGGSALSAQDRYSLKVPNGLAFSEFKGYEGWQVIAVSHNGGLLAVILGNPAMITAFKGYGEFEYDAASDTFRPGTVKDNPPQENNAKCGFACHTIVKNQDYVFTAYPKR